MDESSAEILTGEVHLREELRHSREGFSRWGRQAIEALDRDDPVALKLVYENNVSLGANINEQTTIYGYSGYVWTVWLHTFLGDTILHLALKQRKMLCICVLLLIPDVETSIRNEEGETAEDVCMRLYGLSISEFQKESVFILLESIDPRKFHLLPDVLNFRELEREAFTLMKEGRCLYTEIPNSFKSSNKENESLLVNENNWKFRVDKYSQRLYMENNVTKERRELNAMDKYRYALGWDEPKRRSMGKNYRINRYTQIVEARPEPDLEAERIAATEEYQEMLRKKQADAQYHVDATSRREHREGLLPRVKPNRFNRVTSLARYDPALASPLKGVPHGLETKLQELNESVQALPPPEIKVPVDKRKKKKKIKDIASENVAKVDQAAGVLGVSGAGLENGGLVEDGSSLEAGSLASLTSSVGRPQHSSDQEIFPTSSPIHFPSQVEQSVENALDEFGNPMGDSDTAAIKRSKPTPEELLQLQEELDKKLLEEEAERNCEVQRLREMDLEKRRAEEWCTGISATAAAKGTGDVWGRDSVSDVIRMLQHQQKRKKLVDDARALHASGLHLLRKREAQFVFQEHNQLRPHEELLAVQQQKLQTASTKELEVVGSRVMASLSELKGLKKLRFIKMKNLENIAESHFREGTDDSNPAATSQKSSRPRSPERQKNAEEEAAAAEKDNSRVFDRTVLIDPENPPSFGDLDLPWRPITSLSTRTNLKYMKIGNLGIAAIAKVLRADSLITHICLAGARISCAGAKALASVLPTIKELRELDLSQNSIGDDGARAIADAITEINTPKLLESDTIISTEPLFEVKLPLRNMSLAGNEITIIGAEPLLRAVFMFESEIKFFSLARNRLTKPELTRFRREVFQYNKQQQLQHEYNLLHPSSADWRRRDDVDPDSLLWGGKSTKRRMESQRNKTSASAKFSSFISSKLSPSKLSASMKLPATVVNFSSKLNFSSAKLPTLSSLIQSNKDRLAISDPFAQFQPLHEGDEDDDGEDMPHGEEMHGNELRESGLPMDIGDGMSSVSLEGSLNGNSLYPLAETPADVGEEGEGEDAAHRQQLGGWEDFGGEFLISMEGNDDDDDFELDLTLHCCKIVHI